MTHDPKLSQSTPLVVTRSDEQPSAPPTHSRRNVLTAVGSGIAAIVAGFGTWITLKGEERDSDPGLMFVIPAGAGLKVGGSTLMSAIEMPTQVRFEKGETAAITIRNDDTMTLRAGPFLVGAGQSYTQRFPNPGEYPIACTVDPAESITVTVL